MLNVTLTGADALDARLDRLPAIVIAALAAKSTLLAGQLAARAGAGGSAVRVAGPTIAGDSIITSLVIGDEKAAAIRGAAPPVAKVLRGRDEVLAGMSPGAVALGQIATPSSQALSLGSMAGAIEAQLKAAAISALQSRKGA